MKNIICVSGPHGAGKSTFIKNNYLDYFQFERDSIPNKNCKDKNERMLLFTKEYIMHTHNLKLLNKENIKIDRCAIDVLAYAIAMTNLGWITKETFEKINSSLKSSIKWLIENTKIIFIIPDLTTNIKQIEKRQKKTKIRKFEENDYNYLNEVRESFVALELLLRTRREFF